MHPRPLRKRPLNLTIAIVIGIPLTATALQTVPTVQPTAPGATTGTAPTSQKMRGTITAVRGIAEVRLHEDENWQPAKVGMVVDESAQFRTGPRSAVRVEIPPDQIITFDRLGEMKLITAARLANGKVKTDIGMKYGRTNYNIAAGGVEHESTIRSPNSTLAVRGTVVSLQDERPFPPQAISYTGRAQFNAFKKQTVAFGGKGAGTTTVDGDKNNAAESSLDETVVDPSLAFARDQAEQQLVATLISQGAVVSLDRQSGIKIVRGGTVPTDKQLLPLLPGNLNFVLRWQGNANLDLQVGTIATGETVYPADGLNFSKSGGHTAFDHQGGPNGGIEIISWPKDFPRDLYGIGINHISGPTVRANVQMYVNGKLGNIVNFDAQGVPFASTSVDLDVSPVPQRGSREQVVAGLGDPTGQLPVAPGVIGRGVSAQGTKNAAARPGRR
jgi:hypothetical protein